MTKNFIYYKGKERNGISSIGLSIHFTPFLKKRKGDKMKRYNYNIISGILLALVVVVN